MSNIVLLKKKEVGKRHCVKECWTGVEKWIFSCSFFLDGFGQILKKRGGNRSTWMDAGVWVLERAVWYVPEGESWKRGRQEQERRYWSVTSSLCCLLPILPTATPTTPGRFVAFARFPATLNGPHSSPSPVYPHNTIWSFLVLFIYSYRLMAANSLDPSRVYFFFCFGRRPLLGIFLSASGMIYY